MQIIKRENALSENFDFTQELSERVKETEEIVKSFLPEEDGFQKIVIEAMNYSVDAGGKRLRPLMMLESYRSFDGKSPAIAPFMAAIEFIHTYSLVHDDLPAMDNDELRRGKPTTWKVYGDAMGILAGDGLLNYAYETAMKSFSYCADQNPPSLQGLSSLAADQSAHRLPPAKLMQALQVLAEKAGIYGMVGGQVADVADEGKCISKEEMEFIHKNKTCALLEASLMIGAILAEAEEAQVAKMEEIGTALGMAFQIQDDILDVTSSTEELGKPVGSDLENDKNTYVSIYGLEESKRMVEAYSKKAVDLFASLQLRNDFLQELMLYLMERKN